jgi:phosphoserine aminotransferase
MAGCSVHVAAEVLAWALGQGGIEELTKRSDIKSSQIYGLIDGSGGFYCNAVDPRYRWV